MQTKAELWLVLKLMNSPLQFLLVLADHLPKRRTRLEVSAG